MKWINLSWLLVVVEQHCKKYPRDIVFILQALKIKELKGTFFFNLCYLHIIQQLSNLWSSLFVFFFNVIFIRNINTNNEEQSNDQ